MAIMARPLRIEYEGAWYHVMNRGAARQATFRSKQHYELFLHLLLEINRRFQVEIHAYCLMPNHYHLLIRTPLANLSKAMRHLNSLYTRHFNLTTQRDGPLFRGRFKSIIVDSENYLLRLSRYIHLNPVKAKMIQKPEKFPWSSYQFYLDQRNKPDWLYSDATLNRFGNKQQRRKYQLFVNEGIDKETNSFYEKIQRIPILGSDAFTKTITETYLKDKIPDYEVTAHRQALQKQLPSIKKIFHLTAKFAKVSPDLLMKTNSKEKNIPRAMAIYVAIHYAHPIKDIARFLGNISYSAVAKAYSRFRQTQLSDIAISQFLVDLTQFIDRTV